jgi:hypothetical protein
VENNRLRVEINMHPRVKALNLDQRVELNIDQRVELNNIHNFEDWFLHLEQI